MNGEFYKSVYGDGTVTFDEKLNDGDSWTLAVSEAPFKQTCTLSETSGTVDKADVDVTMTCNDKYWRHPADLTSYINPTGTVVAEPKVAMDDNGNAIIVWHQRGGSLDNYQVFKSEFRNGVWTHPANTNEDISADEWSAEEPHVAMDNNGNAIIVWYDDAENVFMSEYRNGVWTHPADENDYINTVYPDGGTYARAAMDNDGNAIVLWSGYDSSSVWYKHEYRNGSWTNPVNISDHYSMSDTSSYDSEVAMSDSGNAFIVWAQPDAGGDSQVYLGEYDGSSWSFADELTEYISPTGQPAYNPRVAMDSDGNGIVIWGQSDGTRQQVFMAELRSGSWDYPSGLTDNISPNDSSTDAHQVVMDDNGNAIIVWDQAEGGDDQIFKSEYRNGSWIHPTNITDNISPNGEYASYPQVAMDNNGQAIIVWRQRDGSNYQTFMSEYRDGAWTHPSDLTDSISFDGSNVDLSDDAISVAMSDNGNAIVVWVQEDGTGTDQIFMSEYR